MSFALKLLSILTLTVAITQATITIQTENLIGNTTNTIHWTSSDLDSDPESFTIELKHPSFRDDLAIANNVPTANLALTFEIPDVPPQGDYSLLFIQNGNISDVFATSETFFVVENDVTGPHTGLVSPTPPPPSPAVTTTNSSSSTSNSSSTSTPAPAPSSSPSSSPSSISSPPPSTPVVVIPTPTAGNSTILNNPPSSAQTIKISLAATCLGFLTWIL